MAFSFLADRTEPDAVAPSAPLTQEQFVAQNPDAYAQESSNPDYDYMLYQMQQEQIARAQAEAQLQQTDPRAYANQKTTELADSLFNTFTTSGQVFGGRNNMEAENKAALEAFKEIDPNAYYNAKLSLLARQAGWDAGQNKTNADTNAQIQNLTQEALRAGVPADQLSSLINTNYANTAEWHAKDISNRQGQGAYFQGIEKVAPAFAALITAGALAPAAGALEAGSVAASTVPEIAGGSFYTGTGFGAAEGLGTIGASGFTQALPYTEAFDASNLFSQGLNSAAIEQNLIGTGLNSFLSADMASLAAQGLSPAQIEATLAASYTPAELAGTGIKSLNWGATQGLSAADALKYANTARQALGVGSALAKLADSTGGKTSATTGGLNPQQLAKYLYNPATAQTNDYLGQIKMNQTPFFGSNQGTLGGEDVYDVSGSNLAKAEALRKYKV